MVFAGGFGGREWSLVVSVFDDESEAGRVRDGCAGAARAGLGDMVSAGGEAGDLDPGIPHRESWFERWTNERARSQSVFSGDW